MLWGSRGGQDLFEVSRWVLSNKGTSLTARNTSSVVIDSLCDQARKEDIAVAGLYCNHDARPEQTIINVMGAILKGLVGRNIPEDIRRAFKEERRLLLPDLMQILRMTITSLPQVFICIDALDEYLPEDFPELLESLRDIVRWSPRTRIFLTGRPYVLEYIQEYFDKVVEIRIRPKAKDIRNYLEMRLYKDKMRWEMNEDFREEIVRTILDKMSDMCVEAFGVSPLSAMCTY